MKLICIFNQSKCRRVLVHVVLSDPGIGNEGKYPDLSELLLFLKRNVLRQNTPVNKSAFWYLWLPDKFGTSVCMLI